MSHRKTTFIAATTLELQGKHFLASQHMTTTPFTANPTIDATCADAVSRGAVAAGRTSKGLRP